jgi:hypothetical protein
MSIGSDPSTPPLVEGEPAAKRRARKVLRQIILSGDTEDSDGDSDGDSDVSAMERRPAHTHLDDEAGSASGSSGGSGEGEEEGDESDEGGSSMDSLAEQRDKTQCATLAHLDTVLSRAFRKAEPALAAEMALDLVKRSVDLANCAGVNGDTRDAHAVARRVGRERVRAKHAREKAAAAKGKK